MLNNPLKTPVNQADFDAIAEHFQACLSDVFDINITRKRHAKLQEFTARALGFPNGLQQLVSGFADAYVTECPGLMPDTLMLSLVCGEIDQIMAGAEDCFIHRMGHWCFLGASNKDVSVRCEDISDDDTRDSVTQSLFGVDYDNFRKALTHHYQVTKIVIETPNISKYGVPDLGHAMAAEIILREEFGLSMHMTADDIEVDDTGDDGSGKTVLVLKKRAYLSDKD
jgi:hypothetical protein